MLKNLQILWQATFKLECAIERLKRIQREGNRVKRTGEGTYGGYYCADTNYTGR